MQVVRNRCAGCVSLQLIVKLGSGRLSLVCFARSYAVAGCFNNMYFFSCSQQLSARLLTNEALGKR